MVVLTKENFVAKIVYVPGVKIYKKIKVKFNGQKWRQSYDQTEAFLIMSSMKFQQKYVLVLKVDVRKNIANATMLA